MKKKVIVGLSGGVDSSVSAYLLKEQGYDVEAVFMQNWDSAVNGDLADPYIDEEICQAQIDYEDAKQVADQLGIKLTRVNFVQEYWDLVFEYFLKEYQNYRTPNPDILCNKHIKFDAFLKYALEKFDCDFIAMGHYAQIDHDNGIVLLRGQDQNKDQTYFLSQLSKEQLSKTLFPIGHLDKSEVRKIAKRENLSTFEKKDSTGICFIGERNFMNFLTNYINEQPGEIVEYNTRIKIGDHRGLTFYTIGQRKGLNIGGRKEFPNARWYVVGKDVKNNALLVSGDENSEALKSNKVHLVDVNFLGDELSEIKSVKFRYRSEDILISKASYLNDDPNTKIVVIDYPEASSVAPGQACVFYNGEICLGGGEINQVYRNGNLKELT